MTTNTVKKGLKKLTQAGKRVVAHLQRLRETQKQRTDWLTTIKRGGHPASGNDRLLIEALIKQMELYVRQDAEFIQHLHTTGEVIADGNMAVVELLGEHVHAKVVLLRHKLDQVKTESKNKETTS